jgi:hypothetical protein
MTTKLELPDKFKLPKPETLSLVWLFLLTLSLGLVIICLYLKLTRVLPVDSKTTAIYIDTVFLTLALGGLWWAEVVKGESTLTDPLLFFTILMGALIWPLTNHLFPNQLVNATPVLLLMALGLFFWSAAPIFITTLAFPKERGLSQGLFPLATIALLALATSIPLIFLWQQHLSAKIDWLMDLSIIPALITAYWVWHKRERNNKPIVPLRFWPSRSLGLWTGEKVYGQDLVVNRSRTKTLNLSVFLGCLTGSLTITLNWAATLEISNTNFVNFLLITFVTLSIGAFFLGPVLANLFSPMTALGLNFLLLTFYLTFDPFKSFTYLDFTILFWPLLFIGALWPLAGRIYLTRANFLVSGLSQLNFWIFFGLLSGLTLAVFWLSAQNLFPEYQKSLPFMALGASFLALAPTLNWILATILALAIGLIILFV